MVKRDAIIKLKCGNCIHYFGKCSKEGFKKDDDACPDHIPIKALFFDNDEKNPKFIPLKLASYITETGVYATTSDTNETFFFNDGIYHNKASIKIKQSIQGILVDSTSKRRIDETINCVKIDTYINRDDCELPNHLIIVNNGIYNFQTDKLEMYDPDYFSTAKLPITYNPKATCKTFLKFLSEVIDKEEINIIQEIFGYLLLKDYRYQKAFCFVGTGANGKSTLLNVMIWFLGRNNITSVSLQDLTNNRFSSARLYHKFANIYPDLSDKALRETAIFKMLTGGDNIPAEQKHRHGFEFVNYAKLIWSANRLPKVKNDDSMAYFRRWLIINFPNRFEGKNSDPNLLEKLTTEEELSGIFNWALIGYRRLLKQNGFSHSKSTEETEELYIRMSDPIKAFLMDCVADYGATDKEMKELGLVLKWYASGHISKAVLYGEYVKYCQKLHLPACANNVFARELLSHGHGLKAGQKGTGKDRIHIWEGIRNIEDVEDDQQEKLADE